MLSYSWVKARLWLLAMVIAGLPWSVLADPRPLFPPTRPTIPMVTGRIYTQTDIRRMFPSAMCGDERYAQVNSRWLASNYSATMIALRGLGISHWMTRFDCNHFAGFYAEVANARFCIGAFRLNTTAESLALYQLWYRSRAGGPHAIVGALTERGLLFIDPQTGTELHLTPAERSSAWLILF